MQTQKTYGRRDDPPLAEAADLAFLGMDMRAPPLVPEGYVFSAINKRLVDGVYETRRGMLAPIWTRHVSADFPYRAGYVRDDSPTWQSSYATTFGGGVYADPNGEVWIVRATASALLFFRETEIGRIILFDPNLTLSAPAVIVQNFNELVITRGDNLTCLSWSGIWTDRVKENVPTSIPTGFEPTPNARYVFAWRERTCFLAGRDEFSLSDIGKNSLVSTSNIYFVNKGRGDELRAGIPIGASSALILKSQSVHVFTAVQPDLSDARIDEQPVDIEFDSPLTALAADGRVWWLDRRGVRTARIVGIDANNKVLLAIEVMSDKIKPLIRRINWRYASAFSAAVTSDRLYFAVALDAQTTPKTIIVWNRVLSEWETFDQWNVDFDVLAFAESVPWLTEPRLMAISGAGSIACLEFVPGRDFIGWTGNAANSVPISDTLVTRGYTCGTGDPKKIIRGQIQLDTWGQPQIDIEARLAGPGVTTDPLQYAPDRTKYITSAVSFSPDNSDGRFDQPFRQDYSVALAALPVPMWTPGAPYTANTTVFRTINGHRYKALSDSLASLGNGPLAPYGLGTQYWARVGPDDGSAAPWLIGQAITMGDRRELLGSIYSANLNHLSADTTAPEFRTDLWQDLGADLTATSAILKLEDGIQLEQYQTQTKRFDVSKESTWCQVAVTGTGGSNRIRNISLECEQGSRGNIMYN